MIEGDFGAHWSTWWGKVFFWAFFPFVFHHLDTKVLPKCCLKFIKEANPSHKNAFRRTLMTRNCIFEFSHQSQNYANSSDSIKNQKKMGKIGTRLPLSATVIIHNCTDCNSETSWYFPDWKMFIWQPLAAHLTLLSLLKWGWCKSGWCTTCTEVGTPSKCGSPRWGVSLVTTEWYRTTIKLESPSVCQ